MNEKILKKRFASPGVQPPYPQLPCTFRWADPFGRQPPPILAPKSLFNFSGGVPGPSLAQDENSEGGPWPSLAQNLHFLSSLGRLRERSRRKPESSKYTGFYKQNLQWYIPWPLQGDPLAPKKNETMVPGAPRDPQGATTRLPGSPLGTLKARRPLFFNLIIDAPRALL